MTTTPCYMADVIQHMIPNGRPVPTNTKLPMESHENYLDMLKHGYRFEAEMLWTGEVSVTISNKEEDVDIEVFLTNGPDVQKGMVAMLNRRKWREPPSTE